ncbi:unnamed protein product [Parascedosporium putredinis]|uniref:Arrestin C-terminal-like domain-containing protein n=1 Tax=Parascedosporium putredinis TaxID=1442378 RepID=A0A9P1H7L3_9PEZI|nr:unnamed protein product [Parascedosporium putredinis]CAI7999964.1 unnamed protein product [Parascedosporium putredinis]
MWPLTSLSSRMSGRSAITLFEVRLDNDFIVFRGSGHESAGQLLKGQVVLCLSAPFKLDELHLRLTGTLRLSWTQAKMTASGVSQQKIDRTEHILQNRWQPFVGGEGKSVVLQPGNYEFPFEYMLPGDTAETLEGIPEASISYRLKARIIRHRLASDVHTYKHLRVIRTLEPSALEFLHAMSGVRGPRPLAWKAQGVQEREEVSLWKFDVDRQHWQDTIGETGQEGWVLEKKLDLPKRLRQCVQDVNQHGIKVRHKIRLVVALKNPDGHVSELRATLPVSIFISPNIPLDEEGNLVMQSPDDTVPPLADPDTIAPPATTPENHSGANSPYYQPSAAVSSENLAPEAHTRPDHTIAEALATRLQSVSGADSRRNSTLSTISEPREEISRLPSADHNTLSGRTSPEHRDETILEELNKVPSYATAVRTPARPRSYIGGPSALPMSESLSSQVGQRPQTSAGDNLQQRPRTARPRPLSGLSESLLDRLSNHSYGYYGYGLDPRPYQGARPTMQCM